MAYILSQDKLIPPVLKVRQKFARLREIEFPLAVRRELARPEIAQLLKPGLRVAVAVGSRGLNGLTEIVRTVITELRARGCQPFIVPAMASHGGATAEGQEAILASYGITEAGVGAPVVSCMDVDEIGRLTSGLPVYFDKNALSADAIIPINRVKPHTAFRGDLESGLVKMLCIGLGKHKGASLFHSQGINNFPSMLPEAGRIILAAAPVVFGLATVENAYGQVAFLRALSAESLIEEEKKLLKEARTLMGQILFPSLDLLIVDKIGKDISGEGMDPNVTRRFVYEVVKDIDEPRRIAALDLTPNTKGNAIGIGLADITTQRLWKKINLSDTYTNTVTTGFLNLAKIPLIAANDHEAIQLALATITQERYMEARIVRIKNTEDVEEIFISQGLKSEAEANPAIEILSDPHDMVFNDQGNLF